LSSHTANTAVDFGIPFVSSQTFQSELITARNLTSMTWIHNAAFYLNLLYMEDGTWTNDDAGSRKWFKLQFTCCTEL